MGPRSCSRRDDRRRRGCLNLGLFYCGGIRLVLSSRSLSGGVLERRNGGGLLNLWGVLLDLGGSTVLSPGLGLEEVANTRRQTAANLGSLLFLLLLLL